MRAVVLIGLFISAGPQMAQQVTSQPAVPPRTWDSRALADWATPLALTNIRPGYFTEKEYYRAPTDNYRSYPVYRPDRELPGYWKALKSKKPQPLVYTGRIGQRSRSAFNWIAAGKRAWDELDVPYFRVYDAESIALARSPKYIRGNAGRFVEEGEI
jgi:hypothetical protein